MSAKRKSSKRSGTSNSSRPEAPPLFIDRDAWSVRLGNALVENGVPFVAHKQRFAHDSLDEEWIAAVGREGWIGITRDQNIRRKPNELAAIRASKAVIFVLTSGNLTAGATAEILLKVLTRIRNTAAGAKRPALFSIHRDGRTSPLRL